MSKRYDLHTHSTASDGVYAPAELVRQAAAAGITALALTDHDTTQGLAEAQDAADCCGIELIPAIELSVSWLEQSVHIVGLSLDPACGALQEGLCRLQATRQARAEEMGERLARNGVCGAFECARVLAGNGTITRTHFAQVLVDRGLARSVKDVFDRYLARGKPGYVPTQWAGLAEGVEWIRAAGGIAVLAHPQRYKLSATAKRRLFGAFKEAGGQALEVVAGSGNAGDLQANADAARRFGLLASAGSDFHSPKHSWLQLGRLPDLPSDLTPVWETWCDGDAA